MNVVAFGLSSCCRKRSNSFFVLMIIFRYLVLADAEDACSQATTLPSDELQLLITLGCFFLACRITYKSVFLSGVRLSLMQNFFGFTTLQLFEMFCFTSLLQSLNMMLRISSPWNLGLTPIRWAIKMSSIANSRRRFSRICSRTMNLQSSAGDPGEQAAPSPTLIQHLQLSLYTFPYTHTTLAAFPIHLPLHPYNSSSVPSTPSPPPSSARVYGVHQEPLSESNPLDK